MGFVFEKINSVSIELKKENDELKEKLAKQTKVSKKSPKTKNS